jgi:hypothetical protein
MTEAIDHPRTAHHENFIRTRNRLAEARLQQQQKDTPAHRAAVAARLAEIDAVLDAHLETERPAPPILRPSTDASPPGEPGMKADKVVASALGAAMQPTGATSTPGSNRVTPASDNAPTGGQPASSGPGTGPRREPERPSVNPHSAAAPGITGPLRSPQAAHLSRESRAPGGHGGARGSVGTPPPRGSEGPA